MNRLMQQGWIEQFRTYNDTGNYWLGLSRDFWQWHELNGITQPMYYTAWGEGQPNMFNQTCLSLNKNMGYKWNDKSCNSTDYFICQTGLIGLICIYTPIMFCTYVQQRTKNRINKNYHQRDI